MLLTADNMDKIKYRTKRHQLEKADAEIILSLVPGSMMDESRKILADSPKPEKKDNFDKSQQEAYDKNLAGYSKAISDFGFKILSKSVVDDKGQPVFKDIEAFEGLAPAVQDEITDAVYDYNNLSDSSVKDLVKN